MIRTEINADTVTSTLSAAIARLSDMTPLMQDIGELMLQRTLQNFVDGTDPDGNVWAPKSPATLAAYKARKQRADVRPLHGPSLMLSTQINYQASAEGVEWGSNMIYAAVMQLGAAKGAFGTAANGSSIPWGGIPARPFVGVGAEDETAILGEIRDYLATVAP